MLESARARVNRGLVACWTCVAGAAGLSRAIARGAEPGDLDLVGDRVRAVQELSLWHVVTAYRGDRIGEVALPGSGFAQTWSPGVGLVAAPGLVELSGPGARRLGPGGFRRGLRARRLPALEWERLLAGPLEDVRRRPHLGPAPRQTPDRRLATAGTTRRPRCRARRRAR